MLGSFEGALKWLTKPAAVDPPSVNDYSSPPPIREVDVQRQPLPIDLYFDDSDELDSDEDNESRFSQMLNEAAGQRIDPCLGDTGGFLYDTFIDNLQKARRMQQRRSMEPEGGNLREVPRHVDEELVQTALRMASENLSWLRLDEGDDDANAQSDPKREAKAVLAAIQKDLSSSSKSKGKQLYHSKPRNSTNRTNGQPVTQLEVEEPHSIFRAIQKVFLDQTPEGGPVVTTNGQGQSRLPRRRTGADEKMPSTPSPSPRARRRRRPAAYVRLNAPQFVSSEISSSSTGDHQSSYLKRRRVRSPSPAKKSFAQEREDISPTQWSQVPAHSQGNVPPSQLSPNTTKTQPTSNATQKQIVPHVIESSYHPCSIPSFFGGDHDKVMDQRTLGFERDQMVHSRTGREVSQQHHCHPNPCFPNYGFQVQSDNWSAVAVDPVAENLMATFEDCGSLLALDSGHGANDVLAGDPMMAGGSQRSATKLTSHAAYSAHRGTAYGVQSAGGLIRSSSSSKASRAFSRTKRDGIPLQNIDLPESRQIHEKVVAPAEEPRESAEAIRVERKVANGLLCDFGDPNAFVSPSRENTVEKEPWWQPDCWRGETSSTPQLPAPSGSGQSGPTTSDDMRAAFDGTCSDLNLYRDRSRRRPYASLLDGSVGDAASWAYPQSIPLSSKVGHEEKGERLYVEALQERRPSVDFADPGQFRCRIHKFEEHRRPMIAPEVLRDNDARFRHRGDGGLVKGWGDEGPTSSQAKRSTSRKGSWDEPIAMGSQARRTEPPQPEDLWNFPSHSRSMATESHGWPVPFEEHKFQYRRWLDSVDRRASPSMPPLESISRRSRTSPLSRTLSGKSSYDYIRTPQQSIRLNAKEPVAYHHDEILMHRPRNMGGLDPLGVAETHDFPLRVYDRLRELHPGIVEDAEFNVVDSPSVAPVDSSDCLGRANAFHARDVGDTEDTPICCIESESSLDHDLLEPGLHRQSSKERRVDHASHSIAGLRTELEPNTHTYHSGPDQCWQHRDSDTTFLRLPAVHTGRPESSFDMIGFHRPDTTHRQMHNLAHDSYKQSSEVFRSTRLLPSKYEHSPYGEKDARLGHQRESEANLSNEVVRAVNRVIGLETGSTEKGVVLVQPSISIFNGPTYGVGTSGGDLKPPTEPVGLERPKSWAAPTRRYDDTSKLDSSIAQLQRKVEEIEAALLEAISSSSVKQDEPFQRRWNDDDGLSDELQRLARSEELLREQLASLSWKAYTTNQQDGRLGATKKVRFSDSTPCIDLCDVSDCDSQNLSAVADREGGTISLLVESREKKLAHECGTYRPHQSATRAAGISNHDGEGARSTPIDLTNLSAVTCDVDSSSSTQPFLIASGSTAALLARTSSSVEQGAEKRSHCAAILQSRDHENIEVMYLSDIQTCSSGEQEEIEIIFVEDSFLSTDSFSYGETKGIYFDWIQPPSAGTTQKNEAASKRRNQSFRNELKVVSIPAFRDRGGHEFDRAERPSTWGTLGRIYNPDYESSSIFRSYQAPESRKIIEFPVSGNSSGSAAGKSGRDSRDPPGSTQSRDFAPAPEGLRMIVSTESGQPVELQRTPSIDSSDSWTNGLQDDDPSTLHENQMFKQRVAAIMKGLERSRNTGLRDTSGMSTSFEYLKDESLCSLTFSDSTNTIQRSVTSRSAIESVASEDAEGKLQNLLERGRQVTSPRGPGKNKCNDEVMAASDEGFAKNHGRVKTDNEVVPAGEGKSGEGKPPINRRHHPARRFKRLRKVEANPQGSRRVPHQSTSLAESASARSGRRTKLSSKLKLANRRYGERETDAGSATQNGNSDQQPGNSSKASETSNATSIGSTDSLWLDVSSLSSHTRLDKQSDTVESIPSTSRSKAAVGRRVEASMVGGAKTEAAPDRPRMKWGEIRRDLQSQAAASKLHKKYLDLSAWLSPTGDKKGQVQVEDSGTFVGHLVELNSPQKSAVPAATVQNMTTDPTDASKLEFLQRSGPFEPAFPEFPDVLDPPTKAQTTNKVHIRLSNAPDFPDLLLPFLFHGVSNDQPNFVEKSGDVQLLSAPDFSEGDKDFALGGLD